MLALIAPMYWAFAEKFHIIEKKDVRILFEDSLESSAKEIAHIYPEIRISLENTFGWDLNLRPSVLIVKERTRFKHMGANPLTVAIAVPERNLIVIDYSRTTHHPFTIENTLKHELCHILLHHSIPKGILPRWLDEGVCQWVSDWTGDIIMDQKRSYLNKAALRGAFIGLHSLQEEFPPGKELLLAYEQSKSFVAFIIRRFGKEGLLCVLEHMRKGERTEAAFQNALNIPLDALENQWHQSIRKKMTWFTQLSYYLYEILFAAMAILAIFAFIRIILKKRSYLTDDSEESCPFDDTDPEISQK